MKWFNHLAKRSQKELHDDWSTSKILHVRIYSACASLVVFELWLVPSHKAGDETSCRGSVSSRFRSRVWLLETISSSLLHTIGHFLWPKKCSGHGRYGRYASYATGSWTRRWTSTPSLTTIAATYELSNQISEYQHLSDQPHNPQHYLKLYRWAYHLTSRIECTNVVASMGVIEFHCLKTNLFPSLFGNKMTSKAQ